MSLVFPRLVSRLQLGVKMPAARGHPFKKLHYILGSLCDNLCGGCCGQWGSKRRQKALLLLWSVGLLESYCKDHSQYGECVPSGNRFSGWALCSREQLRQDFFIPICSAEKINLYPHEL